MDAADESDDFQVSFKQFKTISTEEKNKIFNERKAANTNRATATWVKCFNEYLGEKGYENESNISNEDLPEILSDFYCELKKKKTVETGHKMNSDGKVVPQKATEDKEYKNTTMHCIRAALNRHFKGSRNLDIISHPSFTKCNEMFKGVTKKGKCEGRGEIDSHPPIEPEDLEKINEYFIQNMRGRPDAKKLQEMLLFYIIYYGGRRGRENLRNMKINTFEVGQDPDGRKYLFQVIKEHTKNHTEKDFQPINTARIYEIPGK